MKNIFNLFKVKTQIKMLDLNIDEIERYPSFQYHYLDIPVKKGILKEKEKYELSIEQKYIFADEHYELVKDLIRNSDKIVLYGYSKRELAYYKKKIPFEKYKLNTDKALYHIEKEGYLFNIEQKEAKDLVINKLKYSLQEYTLGPNYLHYPDIRRNYIVKSKYCFKDKFMYFLRGDSAIAKFRLNGGVVEDYSYFVDDYIDKFFPRSFPPDMILNIRNFDELQSNSYKNYDYLEFAIAKGELDGARAYDLSNDEIQVFSDRFHELLKNLVSKTDKIIIYWYPEKEIEYYKQNLKFSEYKILTKGRFYAFNTEDYLFDIQDKKFEI